MIDWLREQDPVVIGAAAFIAGGLLQAVIDLGGRELSARSEEARQLRRERRQAWLDAIEATLRHTITYGDYLLRRSGPVGDKASYDSSEHIKARLGLIGDAERLKRFQAIIAKFYARIPGDPVPPEDVIELFAAREGVENALAEQADRVRAGGEPSEIPGEDVEVITAIGPMIRDHVARAMRAQAELRARRAESASDNAAPLP